ncbi:contactin-associated protein 1 [Pristis pectinata]|uniref:contactin-associated protein 1 n=1 Tax=Pristis pectinata TaxID=685728 RepID=UPI00223D32A6|nr:contactin-associated protein 1 [Pristis pectinata]
MSRNSPAAVLWLLLTAAAAACTAERCNQSLATPQFSSSFTASSYYSISYSPGYGRLYGGGGWSPQISDRLPWLQINLSQRSKITAIATQGTYNSNDWVTKYLFLYSDQGRNWNPFYQQGHNWTFAGNRNADSVVLHELWRPVLAQFVRFVAISWRPRHYVGLRVEVYGCPYDSDVVSFDGNSSLSYQFQERHTRTLFDSISFNFKTWIKDGLLLHSEGEQGDYITVELKQAKLLFHINLGSSSVHPVMGETSITLGSLLDDQHWHMVQIERYGQEVNLTLDGHVERFLTNGDFDYLDLDSAIYFGGLITPERERLADKPNFQGCLENIFYNNISVIDLARARHSQTQSLGDVRFHCRLPATGPPFYPLTFVSAASFLQLPGQPFLPQLTLNFSFRSFDSSGLLLFTNFSRGLGWLQMELSAGQLNLSIQQSSNRRLEFAAGYNLTDGHWHSVHLLARMDSVVVVIDEQEDSAVRVNHALRVETGDQYFFGGCPASMKNLGCFSNASEFHGCMQLFYIDNNLVDLELVKRRKLGRYSEMLFDTCGVADRCTPNLCEHGGICLQTAENFVCDCERTGYKGVTCHNSLYPESCDGYRRLGVRQSGNYTVDPDGSGPARPFTVHCTMTEDKAWTVVYHLQQQDTKVTGSTLERPYVGRIQYYNNTEEEISAITLEAEYCEQSISFSCYRSRLLNSPSGLPFTWWLGRGSEKHFYWGDASPGIQRCSCGMNRVCADPKYYCNCDADYKQWKYDRGLLRVKEDLPVTKVVVGDTNRSSSEARFNVGPLRCYGDGGSWNGATFIQGNYMVFPPFSPGPSADISLYFKTTSPYGVFLENSGYWDFIRLELKSEKVIVFSFNVGDGPQELRVEGTTPLNDDAWHFVEAEINVKFSRLRLDELPWRVLEAPPQSYVSLRLDRPLYVGAAEYRRDAFFGCIRGLRMNGVILDLEGKAQLTEGANPGCVGQCSEPGVLCQNGGHCVERYSTYTCDCNASAFDGPFCEKVIGGYFEPGTYIRYSFQTAFTAAVREFANMMLPFSPGFNSTSEEIVFSFKTLEPPSVLMYISTYTRDYLAVIIKHDGSLELRYQLGSFTNPYTRTLVKENVADGRAHRVNITRRAREIYTQVDQDPVIWERISLWGDKNFDSPKSLFLGRVIEIGVLDPEIQRFNTPGFTGCLAGVSFNGIVPLKAALRTNTNQSVVVQGELVESNCGAAPVILSSVLLPDDPWALQPDTPRFGSDSLTGAVIGVIVALILFTILALAVLLFLFYHRHKGSYHTNEAKPLEPSTGAKASSLKKDLPQILEETKGE